MGLLLVVILAFADDIKVFARCYDEACDMTQFIVEECAEIGLTIRAAKCAVLSPDSRDIVMNNGSVSEVIASKQMATYLGLEVDYPGIHCVGKLGTAVFCLKNAI